MRLLHSYIFWTHERGSFHYDVMVTLILAFLFASPFFIDYKDRPQPELPARSSEVLVKPAGHVGNEVRLVCEIRADDLRHNDGDEVLRADALRILDPVTGPVHIQKIDPVLDPHRHVVAYDVFVVR